MTSVFGDLNLDSLGLAQDLWNSVADELERRLVDADAHPDRGIPWETVRVRARWSR